MKIIKFLTISFVLAVSSNVWADNVFVVALEKGDSSTPAPVTRNTAAVYQMLQQQAGSTAPIMIHAHLIKRFINQKHCGRIVFWLEQPESKHAWPQIGGEFNICEDGFPPWRICQDHPADLVPPDATCSDGKPSIDTPEVRAAIEESLKQGALSREQVRQQLLNQYHRGKDSQ